MACMQDKNGQAVCPHCGYAEGAPNPPPALPVGTVLQGKYIVGKFLSADGEGLTYAAFDCVQKSRAILREFFPTTELAARKDEDGALQPLAGKEESFQHYLHDFLMNARCVARMRDLSGVIVIYDIFKENGTAYYVTEDWEGMTLREYVERSEGPVPWNAARALFMPVLSTLSAMHDAGIFHFGMSPDTLLITKSGKMKLNGFRITAIRREDTELPPSLTQGCAAIEQYKPTSATGPYTDIYAFAACLFFTLTKRLPQDAPRRKTDGRLLIPTSILKQIPQHVTAAMANALQVDPEKRTQSFERLRAELSAAPVVAVEQDKAPQVQRAQEPPPQKEKRAKRKPLPDFVVGILSAVIALLVFGLAGLAYISLTGNEEENAPSGSAPPAVSSNAADPVESSSGAASQPDAAFPSDMVPAPKLTGMTLEQAKKNHASFKIYVTSRDFNDDVKEGLILSQSIAEGDPVSAGGIITVVLSMGSQYRTLPPVAGKDLVQAKTELIAAGFTIGETETEPSTTAAPGTVLRYKAHTAGKQYEYGIAVDLIVASSVS